MCHVAFYNLYPADPVGWSIPDRTYHILSDSRIFCSVFCCQLSGTVPVLYEKNRGCFAGLGRAVNNFSAVCTSAVSLSLVKSGNSLLIYSVTIVLFVLVGISLYLYAVNSNIIYAGDAAENPEKEGASDNSDKMRHFAEAFGLTERETEVMEALLTSDEGIQGLAEKIYISRAMLYRHIASLNEKTGTQNRIGLIQFYYTWNEKCNILQ